MDHEDLSQLPRNKMKRKSLWEKSDTDEEMNESSHQGHQRQPKEGRKGDHEKREEEAKANPYLKVERDAN